MAEGGGLDPHTCKRYRRLSRPRQVPPGSPSIWQMAELSIPIPLIKVPTAFEAGPGAVLVHHPSGREQQSCPACRFHGTERFPSVAGSYPVYSLWLPHSESDRETPGSGPGPYAILVWGSLFLSVISGNPRHEQARNMWIVRAVGVGPTMTPESHSDRYTNSLRSHMASADRAARPSPLSKRGVLLLNYAENMASPGCAAHPSSGPDPDVLLLYYGEVFDEENPV